MALQALGMVETRGLVPLIEDDDRGDRTEQPSERLVKEIDTWHCKHWGWSRRGGSCP